MDKTEVLELLLYTRGKTLRDNEAVPTKIHLQKEMFLLEKETSLLEKPLFEFVPHYYGPYSRDLEEETISLIIAGKIDDSEGYFLTPLGFREAHELWKKLTPAQVRALVRIKENYNKKSTKELLDYVYEKYKKYTTKSALLLDNILENFHKFAVENDITEEYVVKAFDRVRHPINEDSN